MDTKPDTKPSPPDVNIEHLIQIYISQLNEIEKKVLTIAKEHLETSFSIEKSIGFKQWLKNNK